MFSVCCAQENNGDTPQTLKTKAVPSVCVSLSAVITTGDQSWEFGTIVYKHQFTEAVPH